MADYQPTGGIMVVGAHAGDAENMSSAAVLKHTRTGFPATIVHLTLGEAGHPRMSAADYAEQRKREVAESARIMGAEAVWLPYPDGLLPVNDEVKFMVADLIRIKKPAVVLTHWKGSMHKDHRASYYIVQDALFFAGLPAIKRTGPDGKDLPAHHARVLYSENWEDMEGYRPDIYLDVTEVWDSYLSVLHSHEFIRGGVSTFRYLDYYAALGITRGCLGGMQRAVTMMSPNGSWTSHVNYLSGLEPKK
ncbi:MAG TPA: PIG-L deacetylase family protein [Anaerolineaceae bacterium]